MQDLQQQFRVAILTLLIIIPIGILGFMILENLNFLDSIWLTVVTLTTVGYGDIHAVTVSGRIFTMFLILIGMGAILFALQSSFALFASPALQDRRRNRRTFKLISNLHHHYIICGEGELVNKTISYLLHNTDHADPSKTKRSAFTRWINTSNSNQGNLNWLREQIRLGLLPIIKRIHPSQSILDSIVIITEDKNYGDYIREAGFLVINGKPSDEHILTRAGLNKARALIVMIENDTETVLTVLTAHSISPTLDITAAILEEQLQTKLARVGANTVIAPYAIAGQYLNNATLRPAVNDFFSSILFKHDPKHRFIRLTLWDDSQWIGKTLGQINLFQRYQANVLSIISESGNYICTLDENYRLSSYETVLVVLPETMILRITEECRNGTFHDDHEVLWHPISYNTTPRKSDTKYTLPEAEDAIKDMQNHFILCGHDRIAQNAIRDLNPERPFVAISDNEEHVQELLERGFRVIYGNPTLESTLKRANIQEAQAIMVAIPESADAVLTVLIARALSNRLLITATANSDNIIDKLQLAGADRVVSPFHVASRYIITSTLQPELTGFMHHVLFNYYTQLETTELYMETDSPWINKKISQLGLQKNYNASIIGIRKAGSDNFVYAPPSDYIISKMEVLVIVTPMEHADALRELAHGGSEKRPATLRVRASTQKSDVFSGDYIDKLLKEKGLNELV